MVILALLLSLRIRAPDSRRDAVLVSSGIDLSKGAYVSPRSEPRGPYGVRATDRTVLGTGECAAN